MRCPTRENQGLDHQLNPNLTGQMPKLKISTMFTNRAKTQETEAALQTVSVRQYSKLFHHFFARSDQQSHRLRTPLVKFIIFN